MCNALLILNRQRFLSKFGLDDVHGANASSNPLIQQAAGLLMAVQYLKVPIIVANIVTIVFEILIGSWFWIFWICMFWEDDAEFFLQIEYHRFYGVTVHTGNWRRKRDPPVHIFVRSQKQFTFSRQTVPCPNSHVKWANEKKLDMKFDRQTWNYDTPVVCSIYLP